MIVYVNGYGRDSRYSFERFKKRTLPYDHREGVGALIGALGLIQKRLG